MPKRIDANQPTIVETARKAGLSVSHTHEVGHGFPDVVVGCEGATLTGRFNRARLTAMLKKHFPDAVVHQGANLLVEIKNPEYDCKLTEHEARWHKRWKGQVCIIKTARQLIDLVFGQKI